MEKTITQFNKEHLINEFQTVVTNAEELLKATANISGDQLAAIRIKAEKSLTIAKSLMLDTQNELLTKTRETAQVTNAYVHENPWRAIGFAASLGVVVGLLIGHRK
jgi:ElaB/YqjD/DUF883 family membrane-anchored ribosome-binding protein